MEAMKPGKPLINPASAIVVAALLALPVHSFAQSDARPFAGPAGKPVCVYKGVMSDAEIEVCTGYPVRYNYNYNYAIDSGPVATRATAGVVVIRAPRTRLAPRASRN